MTVGLTMTISMHGHVLYRDVPIGPIHLYILIMYVKNQDKQLAFLLNH